MRETRHRTSRRVERQSTSRGAIQETPKSTGGRLLRMRETFTRNTVTASRNSTKKPRQKKPIPSYLQRSQTELASDPNMDTRILSLPNEMVLELVNQMSPDTRVCFTLTCKEALRIVGTWPWADPVVRKRPTTHHFPGGESRFDLLELLLRDTSEHLEMCNRCNVLHPPLKDPSTHRPTHLTKWCFGQDGIIDYLPQDSSGPGGYSVVWPHILKAFESQPDQDARSITTTPIESFNGDFTLPGPPIAYRLVSSCSWIDRGLVMKHQHRIRSAVSRKPLQATDVLSIPLRLCPHQTTTTAEPPGSRYTTHHVPNGPLLTHAIATAFPQNLRAGVPKSDIFRKPTGTESEQMVTADNGEHVIWRCRSCPTKFDVRHVSADSAVSGDDGAELVVTTWHFFGRDLHHANKYWPMFAYREGPFLGKEKRNSEFHAHTKNVPDFKHEAESETG